MILAILTLLFLISILGVLGYLVFCIIQESRYYIGSNEKTVKKTVALSVFGAITVIFGLYYIHLLVD